MIKILTGIIAAILCILNTVFWTLPIFIGAFFRFIIPVPGWKKFWDRFIDQLPICWMEVNSFITHVTTKIEWDVQGVENLSMNDWYLVISNHRSWADILILGKVFNRKIPILKFFMKKELLWGMPFAGWAAYLVGFPTLHRHTKSYLAKHPEQKGRDMEITRRACEKFKNKPTAVINFPEGTRFTAEKHERQASPYEYLLRPKAGGLAFALYAMGDYFHKILNVTIIYPEGNLNFFDYFSGKINKIIIRVETLPITPDLLGNYENDREFRVYFQNWLNGVWKKKDDLIKEIKDNNAK